MLILNNMIASYFRSIVWEHSPDPHEFITRSAEL